MENITIRKHINEQGLVSMFEFGGMLVLEHSDEFKNELVTSLKNLNNELAIVIRDVLEIDISCIQVILAFIKFLDDHHISYRFEWSLSEEHRTLLENVGFGNELYLN